MTPDPHAPGSRLATLLFELFDPVPYGFLVGALIFDAVYAQSGEVLWFKAAAWLIAIGLLFALPPRLIDLARVMLSGRRPRPLHALASFWLNLAAIAAAILNAFVHSRDAFGVMPEGLWLSCLTVLLLVLARALPVVRPMRTAVRS